jgi:hypothetical protein
MVSQYVSEEKQARKMKIHHSCLFEDGNESGTAWNGLAYDYVNKRKLSFVRGKNEHISHKCGSIINELSGRFQ